MIIIEADLKLGKQNKVTFEEAYRKLVCIKKLSRKELKIRLLNDEEVGNNLLYYYRVRPYLKPVMDKVMDNFKKKLENDIRKLYATEGGK